MITKEDVEETFSQHPNLKPPSKIFVLEAPVVAQIDGHSLLRGSRLVGSDTIFLTPQATKETISHETIHSLGFREFGAELGGKLLTRFRNFIPPILKRKKVKFEEKEVPFSKIKEYGFRVAKGEEPGTITVFEKKG